MINPKSIRNKRATGVRTGTVMVEMVFVVPLLLVLFFGLWEWSRVEMIRHVCENAVFEGARHGTLPGATEQSTAQIVNDVLDVYSIQGADVNSSFDIGTGRSTVSISVPTDQNFRLGFAFFAGKAITSEMYLDQ